MQTPPANGATSPGLARAITLSSANRNADLFVTGNFTELLRSLRDDEKKSVYFA
jgi:hypothetical protein